MQKRSLKQSGVVDADFEYTPRRSSARSAETPLAMKTRSLASLMIGAAISLASLIALVSLMISNYKLYISSMSLLLQLIVWGLVIGVPVTACVIFGKLAYKGVRHMAYDFTGLSESRAEQKRLNALNAAEVARIHAEAQRINAEAMSRMRTIDFDQYGNAAVIGVNPASIAQLYGQYPQPVPKSITTNNNAALLNAGQEQEQAEQIEQVVHYAAIADEVPDELSLLGIHPDNGNLEIVSPDNYKTTWFVGGSNMGKTNTVYGKVADAVRWNARLIICDNHAHKSDSLANKLSDFHGNLLMPIAQTDEAIKNAILGFLHEFKQRRDSGASCQEKWLIVCDEVNATCEHVVKISDAEKEMLKQDYGIVVRDNFVKLKVFLQALVQTCGYESRGFEMFGYFISQKVAGLSWLRNAMMTVFVHGLLMESEARLAANNNPEHTKLIMNFKKGRTLVYGYEFDPMILQQPKYEITQVVDADPNMPIMQRSAARSSNQTASDIGTISELAQEADGTPMITENAPTGFELKKLLNEIGKMKALGSSNAEILKHYELHPAGRNNINLSAMIELANEVNSDTAE